MMNRKQNQTPGMSIDQALELFLALTYPNGIPDGVDKEKLMDALRQKIARDRPQWAQAHHGDSPASQSGPEPQNYAKVKEKIIQKARLEEIPGDPEERYLYNRHKEAAQNRENKKEEKREHQIRENLRKRLLDNKKEADKETLENALRIRKLLEQRLNRSLQNRTGNEVQPSNREKTTLNMNRPLAVPPPEPSVPKSVQSPRLPRFQNLPSVPPVPAPFGFTPTQGKNGKEAAREFYNRIKDLSTPDKVRGLREFNLARRSNLKTRDQLLSSRKPDPFENREGAFSIHIGPMEKEMEDDAGYRVKNKVEYHLKDKVKPKVPDKLEYNVEHNVEYNTEYNVEYNAEYNVECNVEYRAKEKAEYKVEYNVENRSENKAENEVENEVENKVETKVKRERRGSSLSMDFSAHSRKSSFTLEL